MISLKKLGELYDLAAAKPIVSMPGIDVVRTVRKFQPIDQRAKYTEVVIKTLEDVPLRLNTPSTMIEDIGRIMNGVLSYYQAQSDLAVNIEGVCWPTLVSQLFLVPLQLIIDENST
eukprot:TRINITY_DN6642_c0_g1_i1.p1 TRINITY_DN6642_c0_g1~~TRINITY_DN6642_c0_g1_i1.p1  ORF type:complete len:116 (+),score=17.43 TRINITY_DN6642_c0_g1_i1:40-387(+)